ncbi:hypothetical protein ABT352_33320 [Streptosporangium sp. NPDC000563]|uniref:hypothetical protein n=1 Tax=Streptosporangium sp. NPDC000563 TaxID=3154366 RepID=UPI0033337280
MQTSTVTNPLTLDIEWRGGINPLHEAFDASRVATLTASMEANGWDGPPIVCDRALRNAGQDQAYTGSHRIEAWTDVQDDTQAPMPCAYIEDICDRHNIDWSALLDDADGNGYDAVMAAILLLPADVCEAYGLDAGGL